MTWRTPTASAIKAAIGAVDVIVRSTPWDFVSTWLWWLGQGSQTIAKGGTIDAKVWNSGKRRWALLELLDAGHTIRVVGHTIMTK
jgi:hypothetical protein